MARALFSARKRRCLYSCLLADLCHGIVAWRKNIENRRRIVQMGNEKNYDACNEKRWQLGRKLVESFGACVIPLWPFSKEGENAGKIPRIREWTKKTPTTLAELEEWRKVDEFSNLGLLLGGRAGFIAVDIDGEEGMEIFRELCNGKLPKTVTYRTPGGGWRLLFRVRDEDREKRFKKYVKSGKGTHCECAFLGDGQQTVIPHSIHPNGGVYRFAKRRSFDEIELAFLPEWIAALMIPQLRNDAKEAVQATNRLQKLASRCPRLLELLKQQEAEGLHEEDWFLVMCLLVGCGHVRLAKAFSALSTKHAARSDERINALLLNKREAKIRCTTLGCSEDNVKKCFGGKCRNNASGEIVNSPAVKIGFSKEDKEAVGFWYNEKGVFQGVDADKYVNYMLRNLDIVLTETLEYYHYWDNVWVKLSDNKLGRLMKRFFDKHEKGSWHMVKGLCKSVLKEECDLVEELREPANYINVQNGLLNLETLELEPHTRDVFTTVQIPTVYDPKAKCPQFKAFLRDIFEGDVERLRVVQEMLGYCLSYNTEAQKMFILSGTGGNGKGVFGEVLLALSGGTENVSTISFKDFEDKFASSQIYGKTLNLSMENDVPAYKYLNTEMLKNVASGDVIQLQRKYEEPFSYRPKAKLVFAVNGLPILADTTDGIFRRLIVIPFEKSFKEDPYYDHEKKADRHLREKLLPELSGILAYAMRGYKRLRENEFNFSHSERIAQALDDYKESVSPCLEFLRECCIKSDKERILGPELYTAYREWSIRTGQNASRVFSRRRFMAEFRSALLNERMTDEREPGKGKSGGQICFRGIRLKQRPGEMPTRNR